MFQDSSTRGKGVEVGAQKLLLELTEKGVLSHRTLLAILNSMTRLTRARITHIR